MSYRGGDHSSSDASANYRNDKEMEKWHEYLTKIGNPIDRFETFLINKNIISQDFQKEVRKQALAEVRDALKNATNTPFPPIDELFEDVYEKVP